MRLVVKLLFAFRSSFRATCCDLLNWGQLSQSILCSAMFLATAGYVDVTSATAQIRSEDKDAEAVTITVRTIEATQPITGDDTSGNPQSVETPLDDLKNKLQEIPYQNFRLVSSKEERFCLKKRQSMQLPNGQALSFRPIYMDGKKVGLWINWKDHDGAQILDTRLHFDSDDSVITGTDHVTGSGTVLAIKAEPIHRKSEDTIQ